MYSTVCIISGIAALACGQGMALAAEREMEGGPAGSARVSLEHAAQSEIHSSGTAVGHRQVSVRLEWRFLLFDLNHREYQWRNGADFRFGSDVEPWRELTQVAPGLQYYHQFNENWGTWIKLVAIAGFEDAISARAWSYNPQILGFYMPSQQTTLYGGVGTLYHAVYSISYPVIGVAWHTDSRQGLSFAAGFPETMLRYGFNKKLALKMDFQWDIRIYHLARNSSLASGGYLQTVDLKPGLILEYEPLNGLIFSAGIRRHLGRTLTVFDNHRKKLISRDVDSSRAFLLEIEYPF